MLFALFNTFAFLVGILSAGSILDTAERRRDVYRVAERWNWS